MDFLINYFASINYFIAVVCCIFLVAQMIYLWRKYGDKFGHTLFLGIAILGFLHILHTGYWGIARLFFAWGNMEIYNIMQAPLNFAIAQGFDTIGIIILSICCYKFFKIKK